MSMYEMSNEELRKIAMEKNVKGNATKNARKAQEILWERRITVYEHLEDDYSENMDWDNEEKQMYLDYLEIMKWYK